MPLVTTGVSSSVTKVIASATARYLKDNFVDVIFDNYEIVKYVKGFAKPADGGEYLHVPIEYTTGQSCIWFSGDDELVALPEEGFGFTLWNWKEVVRPLKYSRRQVLQTSGSETQIVNMVEAMVKRAKDSINKTFNESIVAGDASDSNIIKGWVQMFSTTTALGGIDPATYTWWKAYNTTAATGVGTANSTLLPQMMATYLGTSRGSEEPDTIWFDSSGWNYYWQELQPTERTTNNASLATGADDLKFKRAVVKWDNDCTASVARFCNKNAMGLYYHPQANFEMTEAIRPANQLAESMFIYWMGEHVTLDRARLGYLAYS